MIRTIEIEMAPSRREPTQASVVGDPAKAVPLTELVAEIESSEGDRGSDRDFSSASFRAAMLVRTMRREASLSQRNLAAAIGVSQARVSEIEAGLGKHGPSWEVMERIAAVCGREIGVMPLSTDMPRRTGALADRDTD